MIADHGGFDVFLEVGSEPLTTLAAGVFPIPAVTQTISLPALGVSGPATFTPTVRTVQPIAGPALRINLDIALDFQAATPIGPVAIGTGSATAPMTAQVIATLSVSGLQVRAATVAGLGATLSVDLSSDPGLTLVLADVVATSGTAAAAAALVAIQNALMNALQNSLSAVPALAQTLFTFPTNLTPTSPPTAGLAIAVTRGTLLVGATLGGTPGTLSAATTDNLREGSGEGVALIFSNRALLQDLLRPAVLAAMPLTGGSFLPGHPFFWTGAMPIVPTDLGSINLTSVRASTATPNRILLDLSLSGSLGEGAVTVNATLRVTATVTLSLVGGNVVLNLVTGPVAVLSASADIAWWVYVGGIFTGGALLATALGVVDLVADGIIADEITRRVNTGMFPNISVPLPVGLGVGFTPGRVAMLVAMPRAVGGVFELPHELLLTLRN